MEHEVLKNVYQELVNKFLAYSLYFNKISIFCDMLRLHGLKRWFEHCSLDYFCKQKGLARAAVDCYSFTVFPMLNEAETMLNLIKFQEMDPTKIDLTWRGEKIKEILSEVKTVNGSLYNQIAKLIPSISANYPTEVKNLTDLAKCVKHEIYEVNRVMGHYNGMGYDSKLIEHDQRHMHDDTKRRQKRAIKFHILKNFYYLYDSKLNR